MRAHATPEERRHSTLSANDENSENITPTQAQTIDADTRDSAASEAYHIANDADRNACVIGATESSLTSTGSEEVTPLRCSSRCLNRNLRF